MAYYRGNAMYILDLATGQSTPINQNTGFASGTPQWSPVGDRLFWNSSDASGVKGIVGLDLNGNGVPVWIRKEGVMKGNGLRSFTTPIVSPDGNWVAIGAQSVTKNKASQVVLKVSVATGAYQVLNNLGAAGTFDVPTVRAWR